MTMALTDTVSSTSRRRSGRRVGYLLAVAVNLVLVWVIDIWPGWQSVSWITPQAAEVVGWVTASLLVSAVANLVYLARDTTLVKAVGDLLTSSVGLVAAVRVWQVFPFELTGGWLLLTHVVVVVGAVGSAIAVIANLGRLLVRLTG